MLIRDGRQDVMLAGGAEAPICYLGVGGFAAMRALASNFNDEPERASRPFDRGRDGFVIGEGAGMLVLEELEHARRRGATIQAELVGYGANCDAYHMTQPSPEGAGAAECMALALADAGIAPADVGYINAHGTGTPYNDEAETQAIKRVFGEHGARPRGELDQVDDRPPPRRRRRGRGDLHGAGPVARGMLPPTINLDEPDPACDLDYVAHRAREKVLVAALSNSFGFGGTNVSLALRRAPLTAPTPLARRLHFVIGKGGVGQDDRRGGAGPAARPVRTAHARGGDGRRGAAAGAPRRHRQRPYAAGARAEPLGGLRRRALRARGVPADHHPGEARSCRPSSRAASTSTSSPRRPG